MNKIISKDTTSLYVDDWLAGFLSFDGENITFEKLHGTDIGKVFEIPLGDWFADEYGLSYETKEYKDKKSEISKVSTLATINTNESLALINLRDALHFLNNLRASDLDELQECDLSEVTNFINKAIKNLTSKDEI